MRSTQHVFDLLKHYKIHLCLCISSLIIILCSIFFFTGFDSKESKDVISLPHQSDLIESSVGKDKQSKPNEQTMPSTVIVDIKGAIKHAGTYEMKPNARIKDLLDKAQPLKNADLSTVNLAEKLRDQKMIYIPTVNDKQQVGAHAESLGKEHETSDSNQLINLNTAEEKDLTQVPGIGPSKAQTIIKYREEHNGFNAVDELKEIKGIGDKTFE
ncbi:competence protein ComEA [Staphylococcus schleiferi]|uniref:helix-hairpin-helix domain-containing protein n=1 Tax=Staphylococcus sp. 191 TaxID=2070016 RepID=UPI0013F494B2|nr:helix-hairpin-helix domain-containing protein [Staphylococcus sp. 191]NHA36071.1 competence protein ComEA [Staphylococcus schleiferi]NHB71399.1 competence protein ComEA [Staphylococcus sp. 191]